MHRKFQSGQLTHFTSQDSIANSHHLLKNRSASPIVQDLTKIIPQNIPHDKEALYQQVVTLRDQINVLQQENSDVKAKLRFLQRDNERMQEIVSNVGLYLQSNNKNTKDKTKLTKLGISENLLTVTLKKQVNELKHQLQAKTEEVKHLNVTTKYTMIKELQVQLSESQQEGMRLRTLLDQSKRNEAILEMSHDFNKFEEKYFIQMQVINSLKQENDYLYGSIRMIEEEKFGLQNQIDANEKELNRFQQIVDDLQQQLRERCSSIESLRLEIEQYAAQNQHLNAKQHNLDQQQQRIVQLMRVESELRKQLTEKSQNIEYLDKTLNEMKVKLMEKSTYELKEKRFLQDEIHKYQRLYEDIDDKHKHMLLIQAQSRLKETLVSANQRQQYTTTINQRRQIQQMTADSQFMKLLDYAPKKLRTVRLADVTSIAFELNQRFQVKRIEISDVIEKYLFDDRNKKQGFLTIRQLLDRFEKEPFLILDSDQTLIFARFLVEDNSEDFVEFNLDLQNPLVIVRSIFTKTIGEYRILPPGEEAALKASIIPVVTKYVSSLKQHFDSLPSNHDGFLTKAEILQTFIFMKDIDLTQEQLDYMFLQLFMVSNNTNKFPYGRMFEIFSAPPSAEQVEKEELKHRKKQPKHRGTAEDSVKEKDTPLQRFDFHGRRSTINLE